ncbi:transcriptional regulator [Actinocrispum wychmicini]|uniref:transcriptional regulator n=1 Tax=Actinocrispum wychmicini TaxID=1213861 RepID=UPI00104E4435|nr:transcriptional regulator [Actinocrispum wychmicini]
MAAGRGPHGRPLGPVRPATARLLEQIFDLGIDQLLAPPARPTRPKDGSRTFADLDEALGWLDERAGWAFGTSRRKVASQLEEVDAGELRERQARSTEALRSDMTKALLDYYGESVPGHDAYRLRCDNVDVTTSILTRPMWLDLACPLTTDTERLALDYSAATATGRDFEAGPAIDRLVEAAAMGVRMANAPVYRLVSVDVRPGRISGTVGTASFAEYALGLDLLEGELGDVVTAGPLTGMDLRDRYLPDLASVVNLTSRLCVGGVVALCAIARESGDYALLVQERSGHVLNAARRLSLVPKGFHQHLMEPRADVQVSATMLRKMEGELFGRVEVDLTTAERRAAAPMHPGRLSAPMHWLTAEPGRMKLECTGFGLNLVSGNYEFAGLIVINDDEFWTRFGGEIEANWEASGMRLYSSLDRELLIHLIHDESWSNEGLFALLQGFRRLGDIGGSRVDLPMLELISPPTASGR